MGSRSIKRRKTMEERFWEKVQKTKTCWLWIGAIQSNGYGNFWASPDKRWSRAHRVSWELENGKVPEGLDLDHLCRVRHCVNPAHLEPVTRRENLLRGETLVAAAARKTHCVNGHPLTDVYSRKDRKHRQRQCRVCGKLNARRYRAAKKAAKATQGV